MSLARDLFAAAREDAPTDRVHEDVWRRIESTTAAPAPAESAPAKAAAVPASTKLIAIVATLGVAGAVLASFPEGEGAVMRGAPRANPPRAAAERVGARRADPTPRARTSREALESPASVAPSEGERTDNAPSSHGASDLAEEARLVSVARAALVAGDPQRALDLVRRTRSLPTRSLEPEELALEARALRALGRIDDAVATELTLRRLYPTHALSR